MWAWRIPKYKSVTPYLNGIKLTLSRQKKRSKPDEENILVTAQKEALSDIYWQSTMCQMIHLYTAGTKVTLNSGRVHKTKKEMGKIKNNSYINPK